MKLNFSGNKTEMFYKVPNLNLILEKYKYVNFLITII